MPELEGVSSQFEDWTISLISDNRLRSMVEDWWVTMNSSNEVRWCFLYFVLRFFTQFSNTQCLQWFVEGIVWFENPLYDSSKLHRTTSDWTVSIVSLYDVNLRTDKLNTKLVQKTSELSLHSSKIWISDNVRGYNPSYLCGLFNWDLVLTTFCTEEVQKRMGFSKPLRSKISKPNFLIYWVTPLCKKLGFSIHLLYESPNWWDVGNHQKRTVYES